MSFNRKPKTINPDDVDPSVYFYDEVYDDMKETAKEEESHSSGRSKSTKSKYIDGLKETADLRKTEKELRRFKKYAKDSEELKDDVESSNKDVYITPTYKKRLEEMRKLEEDQRKCLEKEKDTTMNFLKKFKTDKEPDQQGSQSARKVETNSDTIESDKSQHEDPDCNYPKPPPKKLTTVRERRHYLRKLLAKRTIGKIKEEAIKRYQERKALKEK